MVFPAIDIIIPIGTYMVIINRELVTQEMERRGWSQERLAAEMGVHFNTVRNLLAGLSVRHDTQVALFNAFEGLIPFGDLFEVVAGPDAEQPTAEQREEKVA